MRKLTGFLVILVLIAQSGVQAQLRIPRDKIKLPAKIPQLPDLDRLLKEDPPVTTSLKDAITDIPFLDDFNPGRPALMIFLPRGPNGAIPLLPGTWQGTFESFCLHAGIHGPGKGNGYAYAPLKGPEAGIVENVLQNAVRHPEIPQRRIQVLLWAIIARSKLSECPAEIRDTARTLLTPKEYDKLNGGALGKIPAPALNAAVGKLPPIARQAFEAEATLREMLARPIAAPYEELERVAVRAGEVLPPQDSREIPRGRWSYVPEGFFVRYFPSGYSVTRTEVYLPESFEVRADKQGRILSIADPQGNRIETDYDETAGAQTFGGDPGVRGYAFKNIRLQGPDYDRPGQTRRAEFKDVGWTLVGYPSGKGRPEANPSGRFADARERYSWSEAHRKEIEAINAVLGKINPGRGPIPQPLLANIADLGNYAHALKLATSRGPQGEPEDWVAECLGLVYRMWQGGIAVLGKGWEGGGGQAAGESSWSPGAVSGRGGPNAGFGTLFLFPGNVPGDGGRTVVPDLVTWDHDYDWGPPPKAPKKWELPWFDPKAKVAQPGNTGCQRLGQCGRKTGSGNRYESIDKARKVIGWISTGTSAAHKIGTGGGNPFGIPQFLVGKILGRTMDMWEDAIEATSIDPPRDDYKLLAAPEPGTCPPVQAVGEVSRARAAAANAFLTSAIDLAAKMRAARFSIERYSGAAAAGDMEWTRRQLENAIKYERQAGLAMPAAADRLDSFLGVLRDERVADTELTPGFIKAYQDRLRAEGLTAEDVEVGKALRLTDEETEAFKRRRLGTGPEDGPRSFFAAAREVAQSLRELSLMLVLLPVSPEPNR